MKKINTRNNWVIVTVLFISLSLITGCANYYRINDTATDKIYYTTEIERHESGSIQFVDKNSGSVITLQNSSINEINSEEFKANTKKK